MHVAQASSMEGKAWFLGERGKDFKYYSGGEIDPVGKMVALQAWGTEFSP